jgi:hypothetical protein
MKYATSPDRFSFLIDNCKKNFEKNPSNEEFKKAINFYENCRIKDGENTLKENNLEYDLRSCDWIIEKCKNSKIYSQNVYAALCNNSFLKNNVEWHCSWRHAGGVVANLNEKGDYIDWYCSGIPYDPPEHGIKDGYVSEGFATKEIINDFKKIGWILKIEESNWEENTEKN